MSESKRRASSIEHRGAKIGPAQAACACLAFLALGGCSLGGYITANSAPVALVGLSANDLQLCAGLPDRRAAGLHGAEFWSYERVASRGGTSLALPYQFGVNFADTEECRMTVELRGGQVSRAAFTRVLGSGLYAASCAPLVETCRSMLLAGEIARLSADARRQDGASDKETRHRPKTRPGRPAISAF